MIIWNAHEIVLNLKIDNVKLKKLNMSELKLTAVNFVQRDLNICKYMGMLAPRSSCIKHWGIILFRYDCIDQCPLTPQIIDANQDESGTVFCDLAAWEGSKKREWEKAPGFEQEEFQLKEEGQLYSDEWLQAYIKFFNDQKKNYDCIKNNCHNFVLELLCHLNLDDITCRLVPMSAEHSRKVALRSSIPTRSISVLQIGIPKLLREAKEEEIVNAARSSWETYSFTHVANLAIKTEAGRLFPVVALASVQLLKTNETIFRKEMSPWQFIHVIVEEIVGQLMLKLYPEKKDLVTSLKKDPGSNIEGVAIWLIEKAISFLIRLIYSISISASKNNRNVLDDIIGPSRILNFHFYSKDSMLAGTINHIESSQENETELSKDIREEFEYDLEARFEEGNSIFYV